MKKFILPLIVLIMFSSVSFAQIEPPQTNPNTREIIIVFGRKSRDCSGFGLCRFEIVITFAELWELIYGTRNSNGGIDISISEENYRKNIGNFPNDYLVIDEDFEIDERTTRSLGISKGYKIKKGRYKVTYDSKTKRYHCSI